MLMLMLMLIFMMYVVSCVCIRMYAYVCFCMQILRNKRGKEEQSREERRGEDHASNIRTPRPRNFDFRKKIIIMKTLYITYLLLSDQVTK